MDFITILMDKQSNRAKYPDLAEFVDQLRQTFGPDTRVIKLQELEVQQSDTIPDTQVPQ